VKELIPCKLLQNILFCVITWRSDIVCEWVFGTETFKTTKAFTIEGVMLGIIKIIAVHQLQGWRCLPDFHSFIRSPARMEVTKHDPTSMLILPHEFTVAATNTLQKMHV
jgi:hypothetical protein